MFPLAPSKQSQSDLRHCLRSPRHSTRWTNRAYTDAPLAHHLDSQIRLRGIPMTDVQRTDVIRLAGSSPFLTKVFVPVIRGRSRTQVGRKLK